MSAPVRAVVIGLGVGEQHAHTYRAHPDAELVGVCDIDASKLEPWSGVRTTTRAEELIASDEVDVVSIASYDDAHFEQVMLALESGKHVFCEKPLCRSADEAAAIAELLAGRPDQRLSSNVPLRLSPRFLEIRERIAGGELGEVFHMEGDYDYGRRHKLTDGWRGEQAEYSVVLGGAIHVVDLLLWMTGKRAKEVVSATGTGIATGDEFSGHDFVTATLLMDGGSTMKVNANLGCVSPHFHGVRIYGTEGTFVNGLPDGALHLSGPRTEPVTSAYPGVAKGDLLDSFIDAVLGRGPAHVTERDVFDTLSVCFAIEAALRADGRVGIEYLRS